MSTTADSLPRADNNQYTVLVVDDTPANINVLMTCLIQTGYRILVERDGESAIDTALFSHPDLILLDILMPGVDGFETCRRMKNEESLSDIPVIFTTALTDVVDKVKGFQAGGVDYITKPFQSEEVIARVRTHLSLSAMKKALREQNVRLEQEVIERELAEDALQKANTALEERVATRTRELVSANESLIESQKRNTALIEAIPDIMFIVTDEGIVSDIHARNEEDLFLSADQIIGRRITELGIGEDVLRSFLTNIEKAFVSPGLQVFEYSVPIPNGFLFFESRILAISQKEVLGIIRDITDRKKSEKALVNAKKKLRELNTTTFTEFRNQIYILKAYISLITEPDSPGNHDEYLSRIFETIRASEYLVDSSQLYQNLGIMPPSWQDVRMVFLLALSHVGMTSDSRDIPAENLEIFIDPLLEKVFTGLLKNALDIGEQVTRFSLSYKSNNEDLVLVLEDDGIGIPPEHKDLIFNRGYSSHNDMDLWIIREFFDISGISIAETGEPGKGSRFEIRVPKGIYRVS